MGSPINYSGFVVAGIGFFLTRFTVTLVIYEDPLRFYLAGVVPLALGLGLAAFGVALAVADVDAALVRTTASWCVIGLVTMLALVVLTLLGSNPDAVLDPSSLRSQTYLSNFLIGGSVGGTVTGLYAARNRRHRGDLKRQSNRLVALNRILRHEILNAVTAIRGYVDLDPAENPGIMEVVDSHAADIQGATEEVKYLTEFTGGGSMSLTSVDLAESLEIAVESVRADHPEATVDLHTLPDGLTVRANRRLTRVFAHLIENAVVHGGDNEPTVAVTEAGSTVTVRVANEGPPMPDAQRSLLESGDIPEYDDPMSGFGLNIVRLLVESYGGRIDVDVNDSGTVVTVELRTVPANGERGPSRTELAQVRPALPHLVVATFAALIAGISYGAVSEFLGGSVAAIGVFYGTADVVVGWLTHEFHSIVFGFMYVGILSVAIERYRDRLLTYVVVALAWAVIVWAGAASVVAPTWLRLVGIPAPIPNLSLEFLAAHLAWGLTLGLLTAWGYRHAVSSLDAAFRRLRAMAAVAPADR